MKSRCLDILSSQYPEMFPFSPFDIDWVQGSGRHRRSQTTFWGLHGRRWRCDGRCDGKKHVEKHRENLGLPENMWDIYGLWNFFWGHLWKIDGNYMNIWRFPKSWYPKLAGWFISRNTRKKKKTWGGWFMMICGYLHFRKPPCETCGSGTFLCGTNEVTSNTATAHFSLLRYCLFDIRHA